MTRIALAGFIALLMVGAGPAGAAEFQVGQAWSYDTRPGEEASQLYIGKIDRDLASRVIFHIYIDKLQLKNPMMEGGQQDHLSHVPLSREALEASITGEPVQTYKVPDIAEGYVLWREAFLQGQAGVFTLPVKEIVQHIEDAFNTPRE